MTKTTTLIKHRYKPVSEFDEVTLASKREYWRTKKREQRARLSKARKKVRAPITEVCKPVCTDGHVSQKSNREFSPASLNSDGSYQSTVAQNQTKGMVIYKKMTNEESNMDASVDKQNGGPLTKGLPLPAACIKVHSNSITPQQTQNRSSAINGNLLSISASKLAPKCSKQASQIKCRVTPSAKSSAFVECKFDNDQRIRARTNTTSNAVASGPLCSMVVCKTAEMAMTEEERVAKRRENWRIKKREQRAKRAEKLKINREKMQWFEKGRQETGRFSRAAPAHSLSSVNTMALRKGKQRNSVMSVDPRLSAGKPFNYGVSVEKVKLSQSPYTPQSVALKLAERQRLLAKNLSSVSGYSRNQIQTLKQNHIAISSAVSMQPLRSTQAIGQSRIPQQKFVRIQRMQVLPQGNETAEERLAKQREYWRIKKREQRAKRSLALKGRLKDRDAFNWRAKRYQFIMEQIRKTPTGLQKMPQSNKNTLLNNPNYGNHFIKGDGTVNVSISQTTAEKVSPAISSTLSVVKSSSDSPMAQKLIQTRDRPVLHSIPNSTNLSANQRRTRRSTFKDITACAPVVVSKLASDTKDAKIPQRSSEATQTEQFVPVYRTTFKEELESCDSCSAVKPGLELTSCDSTKQEQMYPSIAMVCSLTEQNQTVNIKEINSAPSFPENNGEAEPCSTNESQSTTLLVVASMKKLLEESLSSVGESNGTSVDKGVLLPCKTEGESFPLEEKEMDRKAELAQPQEFPTDTYSSVVAIQSPSPCHSPLQMHDFSSDSPDLSCRDALLQPSCTASCLNKSPGDERCELPVAACVTPLHTGNSVLSGKTSGPQWNIPPQVHGFQQLNENSELQKKREYWRVMKRQQRARKAKEMEKGKDALPPFQRKYGSSQVNHLPVAQKINHTSLENPVILPNVTSRPARPVLSPAALSNQQPSNETRQLLCEVQKGKTKCSEVCQVNKRQLQCQGNVLSSATRPGTMTSMLTNHVKLSDSRIQTRGSSMSKFNRTPSQLKITPNQELELDEATQRKRMHWRIKKQEQRARKAAREKELNHQTTFNQSRHSWSNNITDVVQSIPPERLDYMPADECQTMPVKDEAETCYLPDDDCLDEPLSEDKWRSIYLMDFDPVNQLLVCMVCGEQQYTFSVEEVRAHIEETHPGTLSLEKAERQRILEAWDEQVAVRERFFTNQLWQNSSVIKEQSSRHTAEIEVILGQDDKADQLK